jgi:16S rRNA (uracil1498-N3)-methyltransferase
LNTFISYKKESEKLFLTTEESFHCAKVLRMKAGELIRIIDGKGNAFEGKLIAVHEKECVAEIVSTLAAIAAKNYFLHIALAPTKNIDRTEWFAEKATELGIDKITFIFGKNSERKTIKAERVKKICESAVKQSMQTFFPEVSEEVSFKKFIEAQKNNQAKKFIAHCEEGAERKDFAKEILNGNNFLVLIGPEGDFTREEIQLAIENGFVPVSLGASRLRTETAGVFVAAALRATC